MIGPTRLRRARRGSRLEDAFVRAILSTRVATG
jgi:hypothetical protein